MKGCKWAISCAEFIPEPFITCPGRDFDRVLTRVSKNLINFLDTLAKTLICFAPVNLIP